MRLAQLREDKIMTLEEAQHWCDHYVVDKCKLLTTKIPGVFDTNHDIFLRNAVVYVPFKIGKCGHFGSGTDLSSLENCPTECAGYYTLMDCAHLRSFEGLPKKINGNFGLSALKIPLLRVMLVKGIDRIYVTNQHYSQEPTKLARILNKHYKDGDRSAIVPCQDELIEAGFEWAAKL